MISLISRAWRWLKSEGGRELPFADINPLVLLLPVVGGGFLFWMLGGLKSVYLTDTCLLVSNYLREIEIPLCNIERVSNPENFITSPDLGISPLAFNFW